MTNKEVVDLMISSSEHYLQYCKERIKSQGKNYKVRFIEKNPIGYEFGTNDVFVLTISGYDKDDSLMDFEGTEEELPFLLVQSRPIKYTLDKTANAIISGKDKIAINVLDDKENALLSQYDGQTNVIDVVIVENLLWLISNIISEYQEIKYPDSFTLPNSISRLDKAFIKPLPQMSLEQKDAMNKAFTMPLLYVWGAPGTGKTLHVLVPCIINYMLQGKKVLVLTPTNSTADNVAKATIERIIEIKNIENFKGIDTFAIRRVGRGVGKDFRNKYPRNCETKQSKTLDDTINILEKRIEKLRRQNNDCQKQIQIHRRGMTPFYRLFRKKSYEADQSSINTINNLLDRNNNEIARLSERIDGLKNQVAIQRDSNRVEPLVVVGTIDCGVSNISSQTAEHIFVDEVASVPLPKGMVLLKAQKPITLFGDHKQLPPVDNINRADLNVANEDMSVWRLSMLHIANMFKMNKKDVINGCKKENIFDFNIPTAILSKTFRYDKALTEILNKYVYNTTLSSANNLTTQLLYLLVPYRNNGVKRVNTAEIDAICKIINSGNVYGRIAVISPYSNQVQGLERAIHKNVVYSDHIFISTIHRAQGREYDTVILSVSDRMCNKAGISPWFTDSTKKLGQLCINVAISRAVKRLIIVCDDSWKDVPNQLISSIISIAQPL